ncbi:MBL fold metallo-hydrolase [Oceanobacillus polygoni]|uniref:Glyoxylase-like metal-dependent hydrolase (Beta-lactamase superfamily II) n=1 Tax=Oceanobacillus polygoni TaxID=1235259 RepID=A0A9X1CLA2_9BACI|nr:MBL fold metallo-hydrolase [Oceanobacillus polygoni]MBP2079948.1 glyoxylase-like metal-dependent hydrolase (beta-lactamase superfamily II) [Oceanobacillus polygoni]
MQTLQKLSDRLFYLPAYQKTDRPILAAIAGDNQTLLIDAGNSSSHAQLFKEQLASYHITGDVLALTHWHWDHVFGLREMDMPTIANSMTYDQVKELQKLSWEDKELDERVEAGIEIPFCADAIKLELGSQREIIIPDPVLIFEKRMQVNLGGVTCTVEHAGGDHSPDSNLIYIQEEKALFLGDCLYANMYAEKWHYTIEKMSKLLEKIESYDAEVFFLSHHPAPLTKDEFARFATLLKTSAELTKKHKGDQGAIVKEMSSRFRRELTEDDFEIIGYFVNGYA